MANRISVSKYVNELFANKNRGHQVLKHRKVWVGKQSELPGAELDMWREHSQMLNFRLVDRARDANLVVLKDMNLKNLVVKTLHARGVPSVQLVSEPRVVWPPSYFKIFYSRFNIRVFRCKSSAPPLEGPPTIISLWDTHRRIAEEMHLASGQKKRLRRAVIINAHKFSFVAGELYTLRRQCAKRLDDVDIFGNLWEQGYAANAVRAIKALVLACVTLQKLNLDQSPLLLQSAKDDSIGREVKSKIRLMSRYKVALVIENSNEDFSEKIWHAWMAGCIPVYVGPDLSDFSIPSGLLIRSGSTVSEVKESILRALQTDYESFLGELNSWLHSPETLDKWSYEGSVITMYEQIETLIESA